MHDEVKRAFTEQALRWHPDRQALGDVDSSAAAEWHMREVNAAWQVLRSPADRADYDDQLRLATPSAGPTVRSDRSAPSFDGQLVEPQRIDPRSAGRSRRRGRWIPVLIVVALVAAGVAIAVRTAAHRSPPADEPVVRTNRYEVGSCVAIRPGPTVSVVSCGLPNSGRVEATTDYPRPCPSGTETVSVVAEQVSVCLSGTSPAPGDLPGS